MFKFFIYPFHCINVKVIQSVSLTEVEHQPDIRELPLEKLGTICL
jgi:hypothetical protein